jgi:predicted RND superfamily exporter protein
MEDSPLILLIPVFGMGLLSDYLIHYFYHYFYEAAGTDAADVRKRLFFPLTLTVLSTLTGFLSLIFLNGSGHLQLGSLIASAIVLTYAGVFLWLPYLSFKKSVKLILPRFKEQQIRLFNVISRYRKAVYIIVILLGVWGVLQLPGLRLEPYPIEQLPEKNTVKKADTLINREFYGTVPFFIEVDTGEQSGILSKESILQMDKMHKIMDANKTVGYSYSLLTVLKRMNYFFQGSEETLLTDPEFDDIYPMLIEQYLLYYSSSVDPLEYESLLDASNRYFSIKGMIYYRNVNNLNQFKETIEILQTTLPEGWSMSVYGMVDDLSSEQRKLSGNWIFSFLFGSLLIFLTVLLFYRNLRLAVLSLIPAVFSMIFSFGIIAGSSLSIDTFSIIFVAIITGLVIDYSIHTLAAIETMKKENLVDKGYGYIVNYSGVPIFLSFLTSLFSFSVLLLSSFKGARNLGLLLITSLLISYFLSMFLLPLLALPQKNKKEVPLL